MNRRTKTLVLSLFCGLSAVAGLFSAPVAGFIEVFSRTGAAIVQAHPTEPDGVFEPESEVRR